MTTRAEAIEQASRDLLACCVALCESEATWAQLSMCRTLMERTLALPPDPPCQRCATLEAEREHYIRVTADAIWLLRDVLKEQP
jgi:hypothetical protein